MYKKWMVLTGFFTFMSFTTIASEEVFKIEDEIPIIKGHVSECKAYKDLGDPDNLLELTKKRRDSILQEGAQVVSLPNEIIIKIVSYMDDQSLLRFSKTSSQGFSFIEEPFKERSAIKLPLSCLVDFGIKHPCPYTASYFIRKLLLETLRPNSISSNFYRSFSKFSERWNYVGKPLFDQLAINKDWIVDRSSLYKYLNERSGNRDSKEIKLYLEMFNYLLSVKDSSHFKSTTGNCLNNIISAAKYMSIKERKEIASFYIRYLGDYFLNRNHWVEASCCYAFCADQKDKEAQYKLGSIFYKAGQIEEAIRYLRLSADQGHREAQYKLGSIFYEAKQIEQTKKYLELAVIQGNKDAQFYLSIMLEKENISEAQKYYQLAAAQGHKGAEELLQSRRN